MMAFVIMLLLSMTLLVRVETSPLLQQYGSLFKAYVLPNCSCEGLAQHIYEVFDPLIRAQTAGRVWITEVEIEEDSKNSAAYSPK